MEISYDDSVEVFTDIMSWFNHFLRNGGSRTSPLSRLNIRADHALYPRLGRLFMTRCEAGSIPIFRDWIYSLACLMVSPEPKRFYIHS